jgi:hypothetical protein
VLTQRQRKNRFGTPEVGGWIEDARARLLASPQTSAKAKARLRAEQARLNPFALKKNIEKILRLSITTKSNPLRESMFS